MNNNAKEKEEAAELVELVGNEMLCFKPGELVICMCMYFSSQQTQAYSEKKKF